MWLSFLFWGYSLAVKDLPFQNSQLYRELSTHCTDPIQFLLQVLSISTNLFRWQAGYSETKIWTFRDNVGKFSFKQFAQCYRGHIALTLGPSFPFSYLLPLIIHLPTIATNSLGNLWGKNNCVIKNPIPQTVFKGDYYNFSRILNLAFPDFLSEWLCSLWTEFCVHVIPHFFLKSNPDKKDSILQVMFYLWHQ